VARRHSKTPCRSSMSFPSLLGYGTKEHVQGEVSLLYDAVVMRCRLCVCSMSGPAYHVSKARP